MPKPQTAPQGLPIRPLPLWIRGLSSAIDAFPFVETRLTPEALMRDAQRLTSISDALPTHVEEALEVLCRSLRDEAKLTGFGALSVWMAMLSGLTELLQLEARFKSDPSLHDEPINPIFITGLPRSGTTFLHRLMGITPYFRATPLYEQFMPTAPRRFEHRPFSTEALYFAYLRAGATYSLDSLHYVRSREADECNVGMRLGMKSLLFWHAAPTYGYLRWLLDQDMKESYQLYRRTLQVMQRQTPGVPLLLKCPHHLAWLPALKSAMPEARIIHTHRDPLQTLVSDSKLTLSIQAISTSDLDWRRSIEHVQLKVKTYADRSLAYHTQPGGSDTIHVSYSDIVKDPVALAERLHSDLGIDISEEDRGTLRAYFADNRQHKRGANVYSIEQFGLSPERIKEDLRGYRERFIL